jgi:hypothetical protein
MAPALLTAADVQRRSCHVPGPPVVHGRPVLRDSGQRGPARDPVQTPAALRVRMQLPSILEASALCVLRIRDWLGRGRPGDTSAKAHPAATGLDCEVWMRGSIGAAAASILAISPRAAPTWRRAELSGESPAESPTAASAGPDAAHWHRPTSPVPDRCAPREKLRPPRPPLPRAPAPE